MKAANWIVGAWLVSWMWASGASAQQGFRWEPSLDAAKQTAAQSGRLVLVHFGAPWCRPCQDLERDVFSQPGFGRSLTADYVAVKLNADHFPATAREYGVEVLPTDIILTPQGQLVRRLSSPRTAGQYMAAFQQAAAEYRGHARPQVAQNAPQPAPQPNYQAARQPNHQPPSYTPPAQPVSTADRYADYYNRQQPRQAAGVAGPYARGAGGTAQQQFAPTGPSEPYRQQPKPYVDAPRGQQQTTPSQPYSPPAQPPGGRDNNYAAAPPTTSFHDAGPPPQPSPSNSAPAAVVQQNQLPPGSPPLGLEGFCPVTLSSNQSWQAGDVRWGAVHRGRTYLFATQEARQEFLTKPDAYSPALSGDDPVLAADQGQSIPGRREHGWFFDGGVYLFANEQTLQRFAQDPEGYASRVRQLIR